MRDFVHICNLSQKQRWKFMQFSSRFKQLCKDRGITQKQALAEMGLHRNAPQRWAECKPSGEAALKISEYFGISLDEVYGVENKKTASLSGTGNEEEFIQLLSMLSPEEQERELAYLREIVRRRGTPSAE
jgi:transcriptional regulator with XRE-family HTH domain